MESCLIFTIFRSLIDAVLPPLGGLKPPLRRSPHWPAERAAHLLLDPTCRCCGTDRDLEVHHIEPVHVAPHSELDQSNMITLCERCHLFAGHLGLWASWNVDVVDDCRRWLAKILKRPLQRAA